MSEPAVSFDQGPRYSKQAAEAVKYIHGKRIIHCDINLGNKLTAETAPWGSPYHRPVNDSWDRCETYLSSDYLAFGGSVSTKIDSSGNNTPWPGSHQGREIVG
ncbi:uncharacterized protein BJX67DRAFT_342775 [Aspergillus lucknowensis]|uniref:Protein kinase domain-containing protein n=1 Tax=Aspergillus lucknowensis TaxID=176173 RepID=A0ABR4M4Z4_9EURO